MADFIFEDPFDDTLEEIKDSLFDQVNILWPDPDDRPDIREGSLLWTLLSPIAFEIQRFQGDLNIALQLGFLQFTFGEFLDLKGIEVGLDRKQGSKAAGILRFLGAIGTVVPVGTTVSNIVQDVEDEVYLFDTTEAGTVVGIDSPVSVNETQKIDVDGTGRFTLTFDGDTTTPLSATTTGATIATALDALAPTTTTPFTTYTTSGDSGIANAGGSSVTFDGGDVAGLDIALLVGTKYQVNEEQRLFITGTGTFEITFDGDETAAVLTENSTGTDVVTAINALSPTFANTYGSFSVSTSTPATQVDAPGGVIIIFDGGGVEFQDVPTLSVTSKTGTIAETLTTLVIGEDSDAIVTVTEVTKGRAAAPTATTTNQNEIQRLSYLKPVIAVSTTQEGEPNLQNQIQRLSIPGTPTSGSFDLTFNDGISSDTATILTTYIDSIIELALTSLSNINVGDVSVTLVSGGPSIDLGSAIFDIEFTGNLRNQNFPLLTVSANSLSPAVVPTVAQVQVASIGTDEIQTIGFGNNLPGPTYGPVADGGTFELIIEDNDSSGADIISDIPYNATAGEIQLALEDGPIYGGGTAGPNFVVSGSQFDLTPISIEYTGKNRYKDFKPVVVNTQFVGAPNLNTYKLNFNSVLTAPILAGAQTQTVESALNALAPVVAAGNVKVRVANGMQTIVYTGGLPTSGQFKLVVDDGTNPTQTTNFLNYNATTAQVKTELEALSIIGAGNIEVYSSAGLIDAGATYTIHFLNSNVKLYRHMAPTASTLNNSAVVDVGPDLSVLGAAYEVEFGNVGARSIIEYDEATLTLAPEPNEPVISRLTVGDIAIKEKQLLTLSHPAGMFKLLWGNESVPSAADNLTCLISPHFDNAVSIKNKVEALYDIANISSTVTVTGGSLYSSPVFIEFSGVFLNAIDWPMFIVTNNSITGGYLEAPAQMQVGFGGAGGTVTGTVQYLYTIITNLGIQDGPDDIDYEVGYGETGQSETSIPLVVSNNKILVQISPVSRGFGLIAPREIRVFRKLTTGFTSSPYRLIDTLNEGDLTLVDVGDEVPPPNMYIIDNVPLSLFNSTEIVAPGTNTTGVIDLDALAQEIGEAQNVAARILEVQEDSVAGIDKVTNPEPFGGGSDIESDDDYRARLIEFIQKDPGAGNIDDYISWAKEVPGIAGASCIPEWQEAYGPLEGPGTVKVIVSGEDITVVPDSKVEEVRQFIAGTIAIEGPDTVNAPSSIAVPGGNVEDGTYEYVYTFINVGKGETAPSAASRVIVDSGDNTVELHIDKGAGGLGVQNTIGRRIYRRKVDGAITGEADSEKYVLVTELLENISTTYRDSAAYLELPTWLGFPNGVYERRKAPRYNSTSLFDGEAPIGAHVTVESISEETIWVNATVYPTSSYSVDGSGGKQNLTNQLDTAIQDYFKTLNAGQDVQITEIANVLNDHVGVWDFKDLKLFSPVYPIGTTGNIPIGPGVSPQYSSAGIISQWTSYAFDKS